MKKLLLLSLLLVAVSCGRSSSNSDPDAPAPKAPTNPENPTTPNNQPISGTLTPILPANVTGGCRIRLVTPAEGETIDLSNGKSYEFAWTTDGTTCETPYTVYAAGNPANLETGENIISGKVPVSVGQVSKTGGFINVTYQDLGELKSSDGTYHWCMASFYGSHPASVSFKVKY